VAGLAPMAERSDFCVTLRTSWPSMVIDPPWIS
jgi:hypothetical protein